MHYMHHSIFIPYFHYIFIRASIVHDIYIYIHFSVYHFKLFRISTCLDPELGGLDSAFYTMSSYFLLLQFVLVNSQQRSLRLLQVYLQYDMLGYYIFVCMLYVILVILVYMGHCYFTVFDYM